MFNIKKEKYDEEETIATKFTLSDLQYQVETEEDLELMKSIQNVGA